MFFRSLLHGLLFDLHLFLIHILTSVIMSEQTSHKNKSSAARIKTLVENPYRDCETKPFQKLFVGPLFIYNRNMTDHFYANHVLPFVLFFCIEILLALGQRHLVYLIYIMIALPKCLLGLFVSRLSGLFLFTFKVELA